MVWVVTFWRIFVPPFSGKSKPRKKANGWGVALRVQSADDRRGGKANQGSAEEECCASILRWEHNSPHSLLIGKSDSTVRLPPALCSFSMVSSTSPRNLRICGFHLRNPTNSTAKSCFTGFTNSTCGSNKITVNVWLYHHPMESARQGHSKLPASFHC